MGKKIEWILSLGLKCSSVPEAIRKQIEETRLMWN
jgi:hypothetical protein